MVATVAVNPVVTSNAAGTFNVLSDGYIQGTALQDPAVRFALSGGILGPNETLPMWGGVGISEVVTPVSTSATAPNGALGGYITRATNLVSAAAASLTGFSVFDQAHAMINTPQSPVPVALNGMQVNFYRLGSGARIALQADPSLVTAEGVIITQNVSWDYENQRLVPYAVAYDDVTITNAVWASTSGGRTTYTVGTDLTTKIGAGDIISVTGVVNTGGSSTSAFNGSWTVVSVASGSIVVSAPAASTLGTYASGGTVEAGGGALPIRLLDVAVGNSMVVDYDPTTGYVTWDRSGTIIIALI